MDVRTVLLMGLLPAGLSCALVLAAWRPWRPRAGSDEHHLGSALAFAAPFVLCSGLLLGWPAVPPKESWQWLIYLPLLALPLAVLYAISLRVALPSVAVTAALVAWLVVPSWQQPTWRWVCLLAAAVAVLHWLASPLAHRWRGPGLPLVLILTSSACGFILFQSGNLKFAQLTAVLAACCTGSLLAASWARNLSLAGGPLAVASMVLCGLMFYGYFYSEYSDVPAASFFLVLPAPLAGWVHQLRVVNRMPGWARFGISVAAATIPILLALGCWRLAISD